MAAVRAQLDELRMTLQEQRAQALLDVDQPERAVAVSCGRDRRLASFTLP